MLLSSGATRRAAEAVRDDAAALEMLIDQLTDGGVWQGADAERLRNDWRNQVTAGLLAAADDLDGIDFQDIEELVQGALGA